MEITEDIYLNMALVASFAKFAKFVDENNSP